MDKKDEALAEPPCKTGSQCTSKCQQCEQPAIEWTDKMSIDVPDQPLYQNQPAQQQEPVSEGRALKLAMAEENDKRLEAQQQEPVAWGIFHFGGKRDRKLYTTCDTREQAIAYIADRHQSDDTNTFRAAPIYTSTPASKPWIGLTEEDRVEIWKKSSSIDGAINATETKLREKNAQPSKPLTDEQIEKKFEEFAAQHDTLGDEWQDMGANDYFKAGFKAAHGIKGDA